MPKKDGLGPLLILVACFCGLVRCAAYTPEPCTETDGVMLAYSVECRLRVEEQCKGLTGEQCREDDGYKAIVKECDAWGHARCEVPE